MRVAAVPGLLGPDQHGPVTLHGLVAVLAAHGAGILAPALVRAGLLALDDVVEKTVGHVEPPLGRKDVLSLPQAAAGFARSGLEQHHAALAVRAGHELPLAQGAVQGLEGGLAFLELEAGNGRAHVALGRDVHPEGAGQSLGQLEHGAVEPLPGAVDGSAVHQIGAPVASGDADAVRRGGE